MGFARLAFQNFRNLVDRELAVDARRVLLVGDNGQGKTNLLEALYLLCVASSFRERREEALLRDPACPASLFGSRSGPDAGRTLAVAWEQPGCRKRIRVDGKPITDRRDLLAATLCVCFVQEDMAIVAGPPEDRRRFFDQTLALADPGWLDAFGDYRRLLRARNVALKARQEDLLDVFDEQIVAAGLLLVEKRAAVVREFDAVFGPLLEGVSAGAERAQIRYRPSWGGLQTREQVVASLAAARDRDLAFGTTTTGPHRDLFPIVSARRDFARYASTGQRRLCALVLRMAQARFLAARTGRRPVLLLDDVLLELDPSRKRSFVERFPEYDQAFFTFLPDENHLSGGDGDTLELRVERGEFRA